MPDDDISTLRELAEEGEEDPVEGVDLKLPFKLKTAIGRQPNFSLICAKR